MKAKVFQSWPEAFTRCPFEGYLWYSDALAPVMLNEQPVEAEQFTRMPFVTEGMLYTKEEKVSIMIRFVNGEYIFTVVDLSTITPGWKLQTRSYLANSKLEKGLKIRMTHGWEAIPAAACSDFPEFRLQWTAFSGFEK